jgi:hypothetical protein
VAQSTDWPVTGERRAIWMRRWRTLLHLDARRAEERNAHRAVWLIRHRLRREIAALPKTNV